MGASKQAKIVIFVGKNCNIFNGGGVAGGSEVYICPMRKKPSPFLYGSRTSNFPSNKYLKLFRENKGGHYPTINFLWGD
jgi:hypothetical protein